jgi:diaminohydroxyphosphoribosylaminopyrimidine deaminase / 5-amino-6-(5-phosphoribosylamino)uracil reductase
MHEQFLRAALQQACLGRGQCAPNPSVGAVATLSGKIIAQSWHRGAGTPHAEILLLAQLPKNCSDITLYVTLEPCNHWGKTPPCVNAIIQSGIRSVVYAYADPNPVVSANNTPALLKQHGISVLHYPLSEIDDFYHSYRHWTLTHTPWVTIKLAQTFDGKIAGFNGERVHLSNSLCAEFTHQHRSLSDVILTTARTVNQDDPDLTVRLSGGECSKPVAIIDARLTLNQHAKVIEKATHCHVYHDARYIPDSHEKCTFHPISTHRGRLDLSAVMRHLGLLGYHDVWVEAGAVLFDALHQNKLINRTYLYLVPKVLGDLGLSAYRNTIFDVPFQLTWRALGDNMIAQFDWKEAVCLQD